MKAPTVDVEAMTDASTDALVWRRRGVVSVSVVIKARVRLVHEGAAVVEGAAPIAREDTFVRGDTRANLDVATDLVPKRARCDVTLAGRARSPSGAAGKATVRFIVPRDLTKLVDKD